MRNNILDQSRISGDDPALEAFFEKLQGNILKGHGRDLTVHIFFQFTGDQEQSRSLIRDLATTVTSMGQQLRDTKAFKTKNLNRLFQNLFLSARGYQRLGFTSAALAAAFPEPQSIPIPPQIKFINGMPAHAGDLNDPDVSQWDEGYAEGGTSAIDGMVLLAGDNQTDMAQEEQRVMQMLNGRAKVLAVEKGKALFNQNKTQHLEHFGYVDGRSQPIYFKDDFVQEDQLDGTNVWNPSEPLGRVLIEDSLAHDEECFGSYFVFRKLEQNVKGFKTAEKALAAALNLTSPQDELAGAYVVGRFEDGTPVVMQPNDGLDTPVPNNFDFSSDAQGAKCPFQAHVRKMNPRGDTKNDAVERSHRITRRGITYGQRAKEPKDDPTLDEMPEGGVGLLFMCFQANIDNQFGFMQRAWANNPDFARPLVVQDAATPQLKTGLDPVIGQPTGPAQVAQHWPAAYGSAAKVSHGFATFVTMKGGEFFFCPSLPFLKSI